MRCIGIVVFCACQSLVWWATQNAWKALFSSIFIIECFLHAFLKIRDRATKKLEGYFQQAADKVWEIYRATGKGSMSQRIGRLTSWTKNSLPACPMRENLLKLCGKKRPWMVHLDFPSAYRSSNQLDRVMKAMSGRCAVGMPLTAKCFMPLSKLLL